MPFSINLNIPVPYVTLEYPLNGSIIRTLNPTLSWSVNYTGTEPLTYEIYLDNKPYPGLAVSKNPTTEFTADNLEDGKKYFWSVRPIAGKVIGVDSEIWSFIIDLNYTPHFKLELVVKPALIELEPGKHTIVKAFVTNFGGITDTVLLSVDDGRNFGIGVKVLGDKTKTLKIGEEAVFNISVSSFLLVFT